ncbi:sodium/hydrogen exchanger 11-like, partial [Callithrix jacchus]
IGSQVLLTGLISFSAACIIIGYVVIKFNKESWDLQSCLFFSIALGISYPLHSVNSLKTIGSSKIYTDFIRGESLIICSITSNFFGIFWNNIIHLSIFRVEYLGILGILALATVGLNLQSLTFKPRTEFVITRILRMFSSVYEHLIYAFSGIVIGCGGTNHYGFHTIIFILISFAAVNLVR